PPPGGGTTSRMDLREHAIHEGERHPWERSRAAFFETVFERHRVRGACFGLVFGKARTAVLRQVTECNTA
ncbi:MAG: hypothetical protein AAF141_15530, partial [Pseudomonadota bacterium]